MNRSFGFVPENLAQSAADRFVGVAKTAITLPTLGRLPGQLLDSLAGRFTPPLSIGLQK